ncbi:MAG: hypothetical protein EXS64_04235 [Candidatus Latescibacteria bacterium]|nr:hypothetical protein [Candidatus Latescibacterota bacterium]
MEPLKPPDLNEFIRISDAAIRDTVLAFFRHPYGFHGDTGIQNYLYHRLLTNAGERAIWPPCSEVGQSVLLLQVEHYTTLTYQKTGISASPGRFDLAFVDGTGLTARNGNIIRKKEIEELPAVVAVEVGKNKSLASLGNIDAPLDDQAPEPGDAAKLIRELRSGGLGAGYLLEFFDGGNGGNAVGTMEKMARRLKPYVDEIGEECFRVALIAFGPGSSPLVWLYPARWAERLELPYDRLRASEEAVSIHRKIFPLMGGTSSPRSQATPGSESRATFFTFRERCGAGGKVLQEALRSEFSCRLGLVYGGKTMTVNRDGRRLFRVGNLHASQGEYISDCDSRLKISLSKHLHEWVMGGQIRIPEQEDEGFVKAVVGALGGIL